VNSQLLLDLPIKIFADGADREAIAALYAKPYIKGLTTNPSLMRRAGIADYEKFALEVLEVVREKPISAEVFSDDFPEMRRQAVKIGGWQDNVYVKIPITNTRGESALPLVTELSGEGVKLNVTAILTREQIQGVAKAVRRDVPLCHFCFYRARGRYWR
jgi:transaldolase